MTYVATDMHLQQARKAGPKVGLRAPKAWVPNHWAPRPTVLGPEPVEVNQNPHAYPPY